MQKGGNCNICKITKECTNILIHGVCLDGAMTSYLLQAYCAIAPDKIKYIAPGNNIIKEITKIKEENQSKGEGKGIDIKIGLYDLALPDYPTINISDNNIINIVDHHISTEKYKENIIDNKYHIEYNDNFATCGIIWNDLYPNIDQPEYLRVINQGDRGKLSLDIKTIDDFIVYIGLQTIIDTYAMYKKNEWNEIGKFIYYIMNFDTFKKNIIIIGVIEILSKLYIIRQYSRKCLITKLIKNDNKININPNNNSKTKTNNSIEYSVIYIPKNQYSTTISQIAGKTTDTEKNNNLDFVIIYPNNLNNIEPRLTIRGISDNSNANELAKDINPDDGGGHLKAASVGVNIEDIQYINKNYEERKKNCNDEDNDFLNDLDEDQKKKFKDIITKYQYIFIKYITIPKNDNKDKNSIPSIKDDYPFIDKLLNFDDDISKYLTKDKDDTIIKKEMYFIINESTKDDIVVIDCKPTNQVNQSQHNHWNHPLNNQYSLENNQGYYNQDYNSHNYPLNYPHNYPHNYPLNYPQNNYQGYYPSNYPTNYHQGYYPPPLNNLQNYYNSNNLPNMSSGPSYHSPNEYNQQNYPNITLYPPSNITSYPQPNKSNNNQKYNPSNYPSNKSKNRANKSKNYQIDQSKT